MITAVELTLSPTAAIMIAQARMITFGPLKNMFLRMLASAAARSRCSDRLKIRLSERLIDSIEIFIDYKNIKYF